MSIIKKFILFENVQQSRKILRNLDIQEDNVDYLKLKELLRSNMGYLGKFTEWHFNDNISLFKLTQLYHNLSSTELDKPITYYKSYDDIKNAIILKYSSVISNQVIKSIPSRNRKLFTKEVEDLVIRNHDYITQIKKLFLIKGGGYENTEDMVNGINILIRNIKRGWTIDSIDYLPEELVYKNEYLLILWVNSYERSMQLGTANWCITTSESDWNSYIEDFSKQYFIYDFSKNIEDDLSMIGVTVGAYTEGIEAVQDRYNTELSHDVLDDFMEYLTPYSEEYIKGKSKHIKSLVKFNLISDLRVFLQEENPIHNIEEHIMDAIELEHDKIASLLLNSPQGKNVRDTIKDTIVMFHIGKGGRFHNAGHITYKGEYELYDGINRFGVNYYFEYENGKLSQEICDELNISIDEILDNKELIIDSGYDFDDLGELRVTDGDYNSGCSYEEWESGIGSFDIDGNYNTYYTKLLSELNEEEQELIIESGDADLIRNIKLLNLI